MYDPTIVEHRINMLYPNYSLNALSKNKSFAVSFTYTILIYHKAHFIHWIECPNFDEFWQLCCFSQNSADIPFTDCSLPARSKSSCENDSKIEILGLGTILFIAVPLTLSSPISLPSLIILCSTTKYWKFSFHYFSWMNNKEKKKYANCLL